MGLLLGSPNSYNRAQANSAFTPRRTRTVFALGDNLTAGVATGGGGLSTDTTVFPTWGQGALQYQGGTWVTWALLASQSKWTIGGVYASVTLTAAQILATHVPSVVATAVRGDTVVVLAGTNGNVLADVKTIHTTLMAAGLNTIACTIPPSTGSTLSSVAAFNAGLKEFASLYGIPLVDLHSAVVDRATGAYQAAYNGDGTHPNQLGYQLFGQTVATVLNGFYATAIPLVEHNAAFTGQLQSNPLAQNALTSFTDYSTFSAIGTSTIAQASDTDFNGGKCYLFTRNDTNIDARLANTTFVVGHRYRVGMAMKTAGAAVSWGVRWESSTTGAKVLFGLGYSTLLTTPQGISRWYVEFTIPTLPDYAYRPRLSCNGAATTWAMGEITVQDLTAMGAV